MEQDKAYLASLQKELIYKRQDLFSSIPTKGYSKKMKDRPLKSEESLHLQKRRKSLLNAMGKALHARDRNKYVSTRTNIEKVQ